MVTDDACPAAATPRAARLFRSVVASSGLLLAGCGSAVVSARTPDPAAADAQVVNADTPTAPDAPSAPDTPRVTEPPSGDVPGVTDVVRAADVMPAVDAQSLVDAALEDARSQEVGWPTTKGVYCWGDDAGIVACCRSVDGTGSPTHCCTPRNGVCAPCQADDAGRCTPTDAAVVEAGP